ncbi:glycosyltransferase family 2 protein [Candidatus Uhrbacteria bacterium]|nr:glycosyltransferase family 2 protein [Candidatus Uhrbacteria bacterium]
MTYPKVGIIYLNFPTKNWERDIDRAMRSFEKLNYPKDKVELILVEPEKTEPRIKDWFFKNWMFKSGTSLPNLHYVFNSGDDIGFSANNNVGLAKARELGCEYVHLTNEDTEVDPDYLIRAVETAESNPKIAIVQSLILLGQDRDQINTAGNAYHFLGFGYSDGYKQPVSGFHFQNEIGYASGAAALVRLSALEGEKLFDEKFFMYHEDTDLSLRLRSRGWKIVLEPASIVWHWYEFGKSKNVFYLMERNRLALVLSYYKIWTLVIIAPMACVMDLALIVFSLKNGWFDMKWKQIKEIFDPNFWKWIKARRMVIHAMRTVSDKELLHLAVADIRFQGDSVRNPVLEYIGNPVMRAYWWMVKKLLV